MVFSTIIYAVCIGVGIALSFGLQSEYYLWLHDGLVFGLSFGVASLLLSVIVDRMKTEPLQVEAATGGSRNSWRHLVKAGHLIFGLWTGLIVGLSFAVSSGLRHAEWNGLNYGVGYVMIDGLRFGLSYGLVGVLTTAALLFEEMGTREMGTLKNLAQIHTGLKICGDLL